MCSRSSLVLALSILLVAAGCQGDKDGPPAKGGVTPTVAGATGRTATYAGYEEARRAFTRRSDNEVLEATLEDATWLRFEGAPDDVQAHHRAYFDYGYTSFQVVLRAKEFTRPTNETFLLEDSEGARVSSKPVSFKGNLTLVGDRWQYDFDLSFKHSITRETRWIRLTRSSDGSSVEWQLTQ